MEVILDEIDKKINIGEGNIVTVQTQDINNFVDKISKHGDIAILNYDDELLGLNFLDTLSYLDYYDEEELSLFLSYFELNNDIISVPYNQLSFTEKLFLKIIKSLLKNSNIVFFVDIYKYLDYNSEKKIRNLLLHLKDKKYYIFVSSNDVNNLYKLGDYSLVMWKNFFKYGKCDDVYTSVENLLKNDVDVPTLPFITFKAKKDKNVKLFYSKDVRDIIKDIYKHV